MHDKDDERARVFHHQLVDAPAAGPTDPVSRANMDALVAAATSRPSQVRRDCGYCGGFGIPGGRCPTCGRRRR
jgi:hypothetical protein